MNLPSSNKKDLLTALIAWGVVILSIRFSSLFVGIPLIAKNSGTISAGLLLYVPLIILIVQKKQTHFWVFSKSTIQTSLKYFFLISLIIFPASFGVNHLYQHVFFNTTYHTLPRAGLPALSATFTLVQLVLIALPEEFFFRGYFLEAFEKVWPARHKLFGAAFGKSFVVTSLIFAFSHSIINLAWWHGFIFFPALVFTWLKQKTGTIWASVLFHAACNLFGYWVVQHYY